MFWLLIRCPCGKPSQPRARQNTAYQNEEFNWVYLCRECYELTEDYWEEQWEQYYRDRYGEFTK